MLIYIGYWTLNTYYYYIILDSNIGINLCVCILFGQNELLGASIDTNSKIGCSEIKLFQLFI